MFSKKRKGFTLAEVLITLAVVGIIASMSIPTLIANKNKSEYVTGLKKAYASVSLALQKMGEEMGCTNDLVCTGVFASDATAANAITALMNVSEKCGNGSNGDCWAPFTNQDGSNEIDFDDQNFDYLFRTADGMSFALNAYGAQSSIDFSASNNGPLFNTCGGLFVDINGKKGPGIRGRDVFQFWITRTQLVPVGSEDEGFFQHWKNGFCGSGVGANQGDTCAARVMEESWQMTY